MRACSAAFKAHLAAEVQTLATCWKATLRNGTVFGFTDHTRDIVFDGQTYESSTGYTPSAIDTSAALNVDNMEVEAIMTSDAISEADLIAGLWDYAEVEVFWVNWADLTMGRMILKSGTLGEITIKKKTFVAEIRGLTQNFTNVLGEMSSPTCRVKRFGDARCKKSLAALTVTGTVDTTDPTARVIFDAARVEAGPTGGKTITGISRARYAVVSCTAHGFAQNDIITLSDIVGVVQDGATDDTGIYQEGTHAPLNGSLVTVTSTTTNTFTIDVDTRLYNVDITLGQSEASQVYTDYISGGLAMPQGLASIYDYGMVTFTSGENNGLSMEVKAYVPGTIVLQLPMPYEIAAGDTYSLVQGCDRSFVTCRDRHDNAVNFRGEPHLPGQDKLYQFGGT